MKFIPFLPKTFLSILSSFAVLILLNSCVTEGQRLMNEGASPAYGQGFDDGCNSGKKSAGDMFAQFHKNVQQYQHNQDYRQGWDDGHAECRNERISMNRQQQLSIEQQRAHDEHKLIEKMNDRQMERDAMPVMTPEELRILNTLGH
jgi:hypothetical protein